jgi:hypothetical protein
VISSELKADAEAYSGYGGNHDALVLPSKRTKKKDGNKALPELTADEEKVIEQWVDGRWIIFEVFRARYRWWRCGEKGSWCGHDQIQSSISLIHLTELCSFYVHFKSHVTDPPSLLFVRFIIMLPIFSSSLLVLHLYSV